MDKSFKSSEKKREEQRKIDEDFLSKKIQETMIKQNSKFEKSLPAKLDEPTTKASEPTVQ